MSEDNKPAEEPAKPAEGRKKALKTLASVTAAISAPVLPAPLAPPPIDDRFFRLAMHEEQILNQRVNIFLVVESILLVFAHNVREYAPMIIDVGDRWEISYSTVAALVGLAITAIWALICFRQNLDLRYSGRAMRNGWPEFGVAYAPIPGWLKDLALLLMLLALPLLFAALWIAFLLVPETPAYPPYVDWR